MGDVKCKDCCDKFQGENLGRLVFLGLGTGPALVQAEAGTLAACCPATVPMIDAMQPWYQLLASGLPLCLTSNSPAIIGGSCRK